MQTDALVYQACAHDPAYSRSHKSLIVSSNFQNGNDQVNPGRIDGYVGSLTSDISADIAHVLNVLGIPQVTSAALAN